MSKVENPTVRKGAQRLSLERLQAWEQLGFGMFIHYGMSTYDGVELSSGTMAAAEYRPDRLDVGQWISIARDTGMKYAVLTAKHVSGFCLWPSAHTDYHVGNSGNTTDVIERFVTECRAKGVVPGLYYCSYDNRHKWGSKTFEVPFDQSYTTERYREFQTAQLDELLTRYGEIGEIWIDIPGVLPRDYREWSTARMGDQQPGTVIMMNGGFGDGSKINMNYCWPTDLIAIERGLPPSHTAHMPWRTIDGADHYLPGEANDPIGMEWFHTDADQPRPDHELLGMYLIARTRGANLLLDVGPDKHGLIPEKYASALKRLRANIERCGAGNIVPRRHAAIASAPLTPV